MKVILSSSTNLVRHFCLRSVTRLQSNHNNVIELNDRSKLPRQEKTRKITFGSLCLLIVPAATFSLGVWQIYRLQWKEKLVVNLKDQLRQTAIDFPINDLSSLENMEYRRVKVKGRYLYDQEFMISPRGRFDEAFDDRADGGMIGNSASSSHGGHFITPFKVDGTNMIIMVNRGWLPRHRFEEERNRIKDNRTVEIDAIIRKTEKRPRFIGENIPEKDAWFYKDFEQMADKCGSLPIYVEAVYDSNSKVGPIGGQTNVNIANQHFSYILTWFTLSAVTFVMWSVRYLKKRV